MQAAAAALPAWAETPVVERARVMFRFREKLAAHAEELANLVTREHGKTLAESRASVHRGVEVVEFACGVPSLIMGQSLANIARQVDCETIRHPVGVCAGITPFNFPAMVPLWMFPIAIVCGNTFVLKPSEKVPLSAVRLGELLMESGLPEGVFNIVHGDRECVDALLTHPLVRAISFVGSTAVARHVYETGTQNGKRVQAAGGAKNHLIIMPDADLDQAVGCTPALGLRLRRRALHGRQHRGARRQGRRFPGRTALPDREEHEGRRRPTAAPTSTWGRSSPASISTAWPATSTSASAKGPTSSSTAGRSRRPSGGFLIGPSVLDRVEPVDEGRARGDLRAGALGHPRG